MQFEGEFNLPGTPDEVIRQLADVERVAKCVPGAQLEGRDEDGSYRGAMVVAFGPKRIRFNGKVFCDFDIEGRSGTLRGRGAADMRAARFEIKTHFTVNNDPDAGSAVRLKSDIELSGVLAAVAGTGAAVVGNALMREFANNLVEEFGETGASPHGERPAPSEIHAGGAVLAALRAIWSALRSKLFGTAPGRNEDIAGTGGR